MRRSWSVLGVLVIAGVLVVATPAFAAGRTGPHRGRAAAPLGPLVRAEGQRALPAHGGTVDSLNWSGYVVTPGSGRVTGVAGSFVVPSAGLLPPGFGATWAGIGGYRSQDLIQAGVAEDSLPSLPLIGPQYYAWYELLPGAETPLTGCTPVGTADRAADAACAVAPGQQVRVDIVEVATNRWVIAMADQGHWTWIHTFAYDSSGSSAEWILEAPTVLVLQTLVAPVGTVAFGPVSTFEVDGGSPRSLESGAPTTIRIDPGLFVEATPSAIAHDGQSFNACSYASSCPTPQA
jgi:hypothetical protein